jgi:hypothetical protein
VRGLAEDANRPGSDGPLVMGRIKDPRQDNDLDPRIRRAQKAHDLDTVPVRELEIGEGQVEPIDHLCRLLAHFGKRARLRDHANVGLPIKEHRQRAAKGNVVVNEE